MFDLYCNVPDGIWQICMRYPNMKPSDVWKKIQEEHRLKQLREDIKKLIEDSKIPENQ